MDGACDLQKLAAYFLFSVQSAPENCYSNRRARLIKIPTKFKSRKSQDICIMFLIYGCASNKVTSPVVWNLNCCIYKTEGYSFHSHMPSSSTTAAVQPSDPLGKLISIGFARSASVFVCSENVGSRAPSTAGGKVWECYEVLSTGCQMVPYVYVCHGLCDEWQSK
jgi:hypothetical protein